MPSAFRSKQLGEMLEQLKNNPDSFICEFDIVVRQNEIEQLYYKFHLLISQIIKENFETVARMAAFVQSKSDGHSMI